MLDLQKDAKKISENYTKTNFFNDQKCQARRQNSTILLTQPKKRGFNP